MDTVNIFATELRNKIRKDIPFITGAWVEFYDDLTILAVEKAKSAQNTDDISNQLQMIQTQIADWNFGDEKEKLPITIDTLKKLPIKIITWITVTQTEILNAQQDKKKDLPES